MNKLQNCYLNIHVEEPNINIVIVLFNQYTVLTRFIFENVHLIKEYEAY